MSNKESFNIRGKKNLFGDSYISIYFIGFLYDDVTSDFATFADGNDNFNRRLYEHFLRPRAASKSYVISPTAITLGLTVLAIGSQNETDGVLRQLSNALVTLMCPELSWPECIFEFKLRTISSMNIVTFKAKKVDR